ncbi:MAG: undecaprenyldiphospho-muramoylpentapeptide beta-N-acetylglucosaminyltransferase [Geobacter sp.]|nr:undecaprenyldiphospho-muramoylpentapeptide beta-N-acetylglucosaminyltransferase [Geobacter sp.]
MRLLIAGGGTGGHLFPGIAVAEEFLARDPANEVLFVGTEKGIESRLLPKLGFRLELVSAKGLKGMGPWGKIKGIGMMLYAYSQARKILKDFRPDLVLGVGGFASGPVVLAARGLQIPRFIHEQNAIPGLTNRWLSKVAERIFISLEDIKKFFPEERTVMTGNPLRKEIVASVAGGGAASREAGAFHLLVFGGSAGAHSINQALIAALPHLAEAKEQLRVLHQTGENDLNEVRAAYAAAGYNAEAKAFIDDMAVAYRWADLVICRAGATTISEVTACGKPCIFIPYPYAADDHQRRNAEALLGKGAGLMLMDRELSGERLAGMVKDLMRDHRRLESIGEAARSLARLDAAKVIVDEMIRSRQ